MSDRQREEIAIIGMAGYFPGARNIEEFWQNLRDGVESIRAFTADELKASGIDEATLKDPSFVNVGAVMDAADSFDAAFFGINPREAEIMDPQHRVFLEASWEAMEHAGYDPDRFNGSIGVFGGVAQNTYFQKNLVTRPDLLQMVGDYQTMLANEKDYVVTRVSYKLNLKGPSISVNTACSSSGVAIHLACQSLLSGECDMAIVGGARIRVPLKGGYLYRAGGIPSPDGHCRAFDAEAQGTVLGSGVAVIVLKRLSEAMQDGDTAYAVIKGTAVNNDGSMKVGFTAPSQEGQAAVIAEALAMADISPDTIGYVEAHGTGTSLGDPIEVAALTKAFREDTDRKGFCPIGSVKTNIGHLDAGAGVAGVIKTVLALENGQIPPSLNFNKPNPQIDFDNSPFYVNSKLTDWPRDNAPRRAGVSSFGLGGTNAHIILEEAPKLEPSGPSRPRALLLFSAKTSSALDTMTRNLCEYLRRFPAINIADVAYTLQVGRKEHAHRRIVVCEHANGAVKALESLHAEHVKTRFLESENPEVVFMFPGQAAQYVNMGLNLYEREPIFRETVDQCAEILKPLLNRDLRQILYAEDSDSEAAEALLRKTCFQQPAIFTIEYALAKLWNKWGVRASAMIGHSIGEYVAACLAGVFTLEDALMLVATRGRMMQELPEGAMVSVRLPAEEIESKISGQLSLAAINAPSLCVVSGPTEAVTLFQNELNEQNVVCRRLHTSHAFHSPMMEPIVSPFTECVKGAELSPPEIPFVSTVTGSWITPEQATDPGYWGKQLRRPVRFAEGIQTLWDKPERILLEVGPRKTSTILARQQAKDIKKQVAIPSLADSAVDQAEWMAILSAAGQLWLVGVAIDWGTFYAEERRHRVPLPSYPFERKRYWVEPVSRAATIETSRKRPEYQQRHDDMDISEPQVNTGQLSRKERLIIELKESLEAASGRDLTNIDESATFLEIGFDSLFLIQWIHHLEKKFAVQISVHQLLDDLSSLHRLADYLNQVLPDEALPSPVSLQQTALRPKRLTSGTSPMELEPGAPQREVVENLVARQLQLISQQLEMLRSVGSTVTLEELFATLAARGPAVGQHGIEGAQAFDQWTEALDLKMRGREDVSVVSPEPQIKPIPRDSNLPLSFAQQRLWFIEQLAPNTPIYNLPSAFRLTGRLDITALERSINIIIGRHEALRTTIGMNHDIPVQKVSQSLYIKLPIVDFSDLPPDDREVKLARFLETEAARPFDLIQGPLVRATLFRLKENVHVLFFMPHHIIFDGWSFTIFKNELFTLYQALLAGKLSPLSDLAIQYADYAVWQREWLQGAELERQLAYWCRQLGGELPVLQMPTDYPRPPLQSVRGGREVLHIPEALVESLAVLGRPEKATLFMVLLAAFKVLLYRYTYQEDVCVGTAIANRMLPETKNIIGCFPNTLVLRSNLEGTPSFREFLRQVRKTCLEAYNHQDVPFERLVEELKPDRDLSRTPLFQALFVFEAGMLNREARMGDIAWRPEPIVTSVAQTDLSFWISGKDGGLDAALEYCTALFSAATITRLLGNFQVLLEGIVTNADAKITDLPLLTESERQQLLVEWNDTQAAYPYESCIHELVEKQAFRTPDKVALIFENKSLTYRELNSRANQLAHYLRTTGVKSEVFVGLFVERSIEMFVGILGILKAGGAYVPLDPEYPKDRLGYMLDDTQLSILVTQQELKKKLPESKANVVCLDTDWKLIAQQSGDNITGITEPHNLAYVIYTSGSTGKPKGAQVPHAGVVNLLISMSKEPGLSEQDVMIAPTTVSFDMAVPELYLPLIVGAKIVIVGRDVASDGQQLLEILSSSGVTVMEATPTTWRLLLAAGWKGFNNFKILIGAEPIPRDLVKELLVRADSVWNMYGPTETTVWSTCCRLKDADGPILIGRPIANTQVYILDRHMQPVPVGVPGELHIGGAGVTRGYLNRPGLTAERFMCDPFRKEPNARIYKTGDLARYHPDGNLEHLDRLDNQVKVRGFRIELGEIESVLAECEVIDQCVATVTEYHQGDTRLIAYYVPKPDHNVTATELREHLRAKLPEYMVPQHFVELDAMPLTPAGKIDRKGMPAPSSIGTTRDDRYEAPRTKTELLLAKIWGEVLGTDHISIHDNFFDIGGHSLLCMQAIARIKKQTGVQLTPRIILLNTLGQIAQEIDPKVSLAEPKAAAELADHQQISFPLRVLHKLKGKLMRLSE